MSNMNERKIAMLAILALTQLTEAIAGQVLAGVAGAPAVLEAGMLSAEHAKMIACQDADGDDMVCRMTGIVTAMEWLLVIIGQCADVLATSPITAPSADHVEALSQAACALAEP